MTVVVDQDWHAFPSVAFLHREAYGRETNAHPRALRYKDKVLEHDIE